MAAAACANFTDLGGSFANESFIQGVSCTYSEPTGLGLLAVGLIVWTGIGGAIWIRTGSTAIPAILALLVGNVVIAQIAPGALAIIALVILNVFAIAATVIIWRASR